MKMKKWVRIESVLGNFSADARIIVILSFEDELGTDLASGHADYRWTLENGPIPAMSGEDFLDLHPIGKQLKETATAKLADQVEIRVKEIQTYQAEVDKLRGVTPEPCKCFIRGDLVMILSEHNGPILPAVIIEADETRSFPYRVQMKQGQLAYFKAKRLQHMTKEEALTHMDSFAGVADLTAGVQA